MNKLIFSLLLLSACACVEQKAIPAAEPVAAPVAMPVVASSMTPMPSPTPLVEPVVVAPPKEVKKKKAAKVKAVEAAPVK